MLRQFFACASMLAIAAAANSATLEEDAKAFGTRERVSDVAMSPSGTKFAMIVAGPGSESVLRVADLNSGEVVDLTNSNGKPQSLRWCNFAGEEQLVCLHSGVEPFEKYLLNFSGLFTISADGKTMKSLRPKSRFESNYINVSAGGVIDWLPGSDGMVLMARNHLPEVNTTGSILGRTKSGLAVERIALRSLEPSLVEQPREGAWGYMTDGRGIVRIVFEGREDHRDRFTGKMPIRYRVKGSKEWREFGIYDELHGQGLYPLAIDADADAVYALKKTNGRKALYQVKLDGSMAEALVAANPRVDIDGIVRLGPGQRIIGYTFANERRRAVYFDPEFAKLQNSLTKALPDQPQISFHGATADGQKILLLAGGDTRAGTFYRFDRATKQLAPIERVRPELEGRTLAPVKAIEVKAPDGAVIPAYLTLPTGSTGKNLPAVVLPHGGPWARDEWGFDWLPQFFAARGFAVIQPNFRGSAGYGDEWLNENGFKNWRTSIGDVTVAAKYLVEQGIADPAKLAIVGWSYGGYAALQSSVVEPSLYKAVVAIAPVTDLSLIKNETRDIYSEKLVEEIVGSAASLAEGSPLKRAAEIKAPVLLVHGTRDANVAVAQSVRMNAALRNTGRQVDYLEFPGLDHQLDDSNARIQMLTKIGAFLDKAVGK